MTNAERLNLLLPWLNGDPLADDQIRRLLVRFLGSFRAASVRVDLESARWLAHEAAASELRAVRSKLEHVFLTVAPSETKGAQGLESITEDDVTALLPLPSLAFDVRRSEREGRVVMLVGGQHQRLRDLIPFLVMHLFAAPDEITIARCQAWRENRWYKERCDRLFVVSQGRGRPRAFCRDRCTDQMNNVRRYESQRQEARRRRRKGR
jgi:hypothetical protein